MEANNNNAELADAVTCAICLDVCIRPTTTPCGHTFCRACLRSAINAKKQCPSCRAPVLTRVDELAVNFALWTLIQSLFPRTNLPESPALQQPTSSATATNAVTRRGRNTRQPFAAPRRIVPLPSPQQQQQQQQRATRASSSVATRSRLATSSTANISRPSSASSSTVNTINRYLTGNDTTARSRNINNNSSGREVDEEEESDGWEPSSPESSPSPQLQRRTRRAPHHHQQQQQRYGSGNNNNNTSGVGGRGHREEDNLSEIEQQMLALAIEASTQNITTTTTNIHNNSNSNAANSNSYRQQQQRQRQAVEPEVVELLDDNEKEEITASPSPPPLAARLQALSRQTSARAGFQLAGNVMQHSTVNTEQQQQREQPVGRLAGIQVQEEEENEVVVDAIEDDNDDGFVNRSLVERIQARSTSTASGAGGGSSSRVQQPLQVRPASVDNATEASSTGSRARKYNVSGLMRSHAPSQVALLHQRNGAERELQ